MNSVLPAGATPAQNISPASTAISPPATDNVHRQSGVTSSSAPQGIHATLALWAQTSEQSQSLNQLVWAESELHQLGGWVARHERLTANPQSANAPLQKALQQQFQIMDTRLQQGQSPLTVDLTYGPNQPIPKVFINHLPLLQTKARDENLQIFIQGQAPVRVTLPAEAPPEELFQHLKYTFKQVGIQTEIQTRDSGSEQAPQLRFSTSTHQQGIFFQPWQISGEGVRVAAGNPLIAPLQNSHSPLHDLVKGTQKESESREPAKAHHSIVQRIKSTLNRVREILTTESANVEKNYIGFKDDNEAVVLSEKIKAMGQSHTHGQWMFSHKNIHRKVVEYGLLSNVKK